MNKSTSEEILDICQIYDLIFKRIFALSYLSIINLINGLFGTKYSPDSSVHILQTEFVKQNLEKRFADIIIVINNCDVFHLEAQMTKQNAIILRVFEYGFQRAMWHRENDCVLHFPKPVVIYLENGIDVPEKSTLTLDFGSQGNFTYQVKNFIYQEHAIDELNQKKMVVLILFQLLKVREIVMEMSQKQT